jgi:hypothetical protein
MRDLTSQTISSGSEVLPQIEKIQTLQEEKARSLQWLPCGPQE